MKALIFQNKVVELAENEFPVSPEMVWVNSDSDVSVGFLYNDGTFTDPTPPIDLAAYLTAYGSAFENGPFTYNGFTEDGTEEHRRNAKETIDFLERLGSEAPQNIPWNSPNHGVQVITLETLTGWLLGVGLRRFKRFAIQTALKPTIGQYTTTEQIEAAFDAAYEA